MSTKTNDWKLDLILIVTISVLLAVIIYDVSSQLQDDKESYTDCITYVNGTESRALIESKCSNELCIRLIIVDCSGGCKPCSNSKRIPKSVWENNPKLYQNESLDILIYSSKGDDKTQAFCNGLINNVYGKIYFLEGGFNAWKEADV